MSVKRKVAFKDTLTMDVYSPKGKSTGAGVVVVHGGAWTSRTGDMAPICKKIAKSGMTAFNITYRLAPKHLYPAAVEDVTDAVKWIQTKADQFNINGDQLGIWGYSAGAHLALMVGLDPKNNIKGIVAGGTPAKFEAWPHSPLIRRFLGHSFQKRPELWQEASPVTRVHEKSPPVFLYHGKYDILVQVDQLHFMEKALSERRIPVETHIVGLGGHMTTYLFSRTAISRGVGFLRSKITASQL